MVEVDAVVLSRRGVARDTWVLRLSAPGVGAAVRPGQFVNLGLRPGPLLRRPFSVHRVQGDAIEVLLRPVGTGTALLLGLEPGHGVSCLGPLGNPFRIDPAGGPVTLLSGGLGVAPMPVAAAEARRLGLRVRWVHGARTAADLCREWEGDEVTWVTEDGSRGLRGRALDAAGPEPGQLLACGPNPMLAAVADRFPEAQVALETYMGCGTGVCLGCAVPLVAGGYDRACTEGPVYRAGSVDWARLPDHLHYLVGA